MDALFIDAIVNLKQHLTFFHLVKILHVNAGDITADLRADKGGQAAYIGVIGKLAMAGEGRQLPGIQHNQYANQADSGGGKNGHHADVVSGVGLLLGRVLLTHDDSGSLLLLLAARRAFQRNMSSDFQSA